MVANMDKMETYIWNNKLYTEEIDGVLLVYDVNKQKIFVFHDLEKVIMDFFDGEHKLGDIESMMKCQYDGYNLEEFMEFVEQCITNNILEKK